MLLGKSDPTTSPVQSASNTHVVSEHGVSDGRFYAYACSTPSNDRVFDPQLFENPIQIGLIEAAESMLVDDNIVVPWLEFRNNVRVPGVSDQNLAFRSVRSMNGLSDTR